MIRRMFALAACLLVLAGCDGWKANQQLIAEEQRDSIGLSGSYQSSERVLQITPLADRRYSITSQSVEAEEPDEPFIAAFDLLRSERSGDDENGYSYTNTYLMEIKHIDTEGNATFYYEIVSSTYSDQDREPTFSQYQVTCSLAASDIATGDEYGCLFADYAELRRAAADALAWAEDPRMRIYEESFFRLES